MVPLGKIRTRCVVPSQVCYSAPRFSTFVYHVLLFHARFYLIVSLGYYSAQAFHFYVHSAFTFSFFCLIYRLPGFFTCKPQATIPPKDFHICHPKASILAAIRGNLIDPCEVANQPFACGHLNEKLEYEMFEFYTMVMRKLLMQIRMAFL